MSGLVRTILHDKENDQFLGGVTAGSLSGEKVPKTHGENYLKIVALP
jgi:hypothetical protein